MNGKTQNTIELKLKEAFVPELIKVENISHTHNVPPDSETHFQVTIVSTRFGNLSLVNRHRQVNDILEEQLSSSVHALTMNLFTPEEWEIVGPGVSAPPKCQKL